ncbi:hypothetical protein LCGC14_1276370 [marine sediment metagenome]|uniref:Uncharacterized protein n=1 Tax=marine sediment metagenome TaxID=412755 RepID=A0A0F9LHP8_9ZZZZ
MEGLQGFIWGVLLMGMLGSAALMIGIAKA